MAVTELMVAAYTAGMQADNDLHRKWIRVMHKLSEVTGVAHLGTLASDSRLDMLLRVLEAESHERLKSPARNQIDFSQDILFSLSECWVLRAYEVIRAGWERMGRPPRGHDKMRALLHRLGLARMPIAKGEIQQAKRAEKAGETIMLTHSNGCDPQPYANNGSYIVPRAICPTTGAMMVRIR